MAASRLTLPDLSGVSKLPLVTPSTPFSNGEARWGDSILEIPRPGTTGGRSLSPIDLGRGLRVAPSGVEGDSVPYLDFRAADRGVILPLNVGVDCPSPVRFALAVVDSGCAPRLAERLGDALLDPKTLGVNGLFACRKAELRLGVRGLAWWPWVCLSGGISYVVAIPPARDYAECSRIIAWL